MMKDVFLVSSGDLRIAANQSCWQAQQEMETKLIATIESLNYKVIRAHKYDDEKKHGFIDSQKMGIEVFKTIRSEAPLIVAESVWQYSNHVLPGLITHKGPILTVANWDGQWPGLVGMLNLNGSLLKAGVVYSSLWSEDFNDTFFLENLKLWLKKGSIPKEESHITSYNAISLQNADSEYGKQFGANLRHKKAIMGVFDEGCMGMFNAIVPDDLLNGLGIFKERLSQSSLFAKMREVSDSEAEQILNWLLEKGMKFDWGHDAAQDLTRDQTLEQCKMYIASLRIADEFGCDTIGIQYQQGLKDLTAASDLVEGLLNNKERPPVYSPQGKELYPGQALPHFNEVDECAGIDALVTYRLWEELGLEGENTLHDIRWGKHFKGQGIDDFVWVFLISGAVPASHLIDGYRGASSERQPNMYFSLGGGTLKGISKPGDLVWSRIYVKNKQLHCDIGVGKSVDLPLEETKRRWEKTTSQWPIMNATLSGVSRNQLMSRHAANHIHVVYVPSEAWAHKACRIKAAALSEMGILVHFCGDVDFSGNRFGL